jgi:hypothetical protein
MRLPMIPSPMNPICIARSLENPLNVAAVYGASQ